MSAGAYTAQDANGAPVTPDGNHTLTVSPIYLLGNVIVSMSAGQEFLLADNNEDFSATQGDNGWRYQWLIGTTYTDAVFNVGTANWQRPGATFWKIGATHQEPVVETGTTKVYATRWWTVPTGVGRVHVQGTWTQRLAAVATVPTCSSFAGKAASGLGPRRFSFRRSALKGATANIDQVFDVAAGDIIEFRVGPGPALDDSFDDTTLNALIYESTVAVTPVDDDQATSASTRRS